MKEMRSERLSRLSASTLVSEAMSASTRQSSRMGEWVDSMSSLPARLARVRGLGIGLGIGLG
jgi:hypothetical protein